MIRLNDSPRIFEIVLEKIFNSRNIIMAIKTLSMCVYLLFDLCVQKKECSMTEQVDVILAIMIPGELHPEDINDVEVL